VALVDTAVKNYTSAWNERDDTKRRRLLEQSVTYDVFWQDPLGQANDLESLSRYIGQFFERVPGVRLDLTSGISQHHNHICYTWKLVDEKGGRTIDGRDFGELAPDGRLARVIGFFEPLPPQS
jgi:hypothetical protein